MLFAGAKEVVDLDETLGPVGVTKAVELGVGRANEVLADDEGIECLKGGDDAEEVAGDGILEDGKAAGWTVDGGEGLVESLDERADDVVPVGETCEEHDEFGAQQGGVAGGSEAKRRSHGREAGDEARERTLRLEAVIDDDDLGAGLEPGQCLSGSAHDDHARANRLECRDDPLEERTAAEEGRRLVGAEAAAPAPGEDETVDGLMVGRSHGRSPLLIRPIIARTGRRRRRVEAC